MTLSQDAETCHMPASRKTARRSMHARDSGALMDDQPELAERHMPASTRPAHRRRKLKPSLQKPARMQGLYYLLSGVWPLLHRRSFENVTGKKKNWSSVQTIGVVVGAVGCSLLLAQRRGNPGPGTRTLALGSAVGLTFIDGYRGGRDRIRPVYLLDMAAQAYLFQLWLRRPSRR